MARWMERMGNFKELLAETEAHRRDLEASIAERLNDKWTDYGEDTDESEDDTKGLEDEDTELTEDQINKILAKAKELLTQESD